ncbi:hypothetical protein [Peribacillus kribbensis]|uniref:hypothetical protein n=1 Tax=Peribacillus kribbensis TaxID=356658 RepID=UPI0003FBD1B5|nr:hypothetical protein [Peribacillus kribbensis]
MEKGFLLDQIKQERSTDRGDFSFIMITESYEDNQEIMESAKLLEAEKHIALTECEVTDVTDNCLGVLLSGKIL